MVDVKIVIGSTLVYEKGRGGTKWPATRYTANVDGTTLLRQDGRVRIFRTPESARSAAKKFMKDHHK